MISLNWDEIRVYMQKYRMADKKIENRAKRTLQSSDVVQTVDFNFADYEHEGDSGSLFLATNKKDSTRQYIVKHAYTDCACNEFVYAKLAQAMEYHVPETRLFLLTNEEKRNIFDTEYIVGSLFLDVAEYTPSYSFIRERAKNWSEYFSFSALYAMTGEIDGIETLLTTDGIIYRIDTTDAFPISCDQLDVAGINHSLNGINLKN